MFGFRESLGTGAEDTGNRDRVAEGPFHLGSVALLCVPPLKDTVLTKKIVPRSVAYLDTADCALHFSTAVCPKLRWALGYIGRQLQWRAAFARL